MSLLVFLSMADVHDKQTRSYNMSRIRGKDTKPEILVRKFLFSKGFRFRLHDKNLPGKPDIVLRKYKTIILVHGCFWHGHKGCRYFVIPKTRTLWWTTKIKNNRKSDAKNFKLLTQDNWKVITIFECELKPNQRVRALSRLVKKLK
jgi:DNA mismatch endonuclease (patch repair protein)